MPILHESITFNQYQMHTYTLTNRGVAQVKLGAGLVQVAGAAVLRRSDGAVQLLRCVTK